MPGFNLGAPNQNAVSNTIETRRKHRWLFTTLGPLGRTALLVLKTAARPKTTVQVAEMHHDEEQAKFAGKYTWEDINLVWYDGEQDPNISKVIYDWFNTVVNVPTANVGTPSTYKADAGLTMTNGAGVANESWSLFGAWPKEVDWGDLDYSNNEIQEVTATLSIDRAQRIT